MIMQSARVGHRESQRPHFLARDLPNYPFICFFFWKFGSLGHTGKEVYIVKYNLPSPVPPNRIMLQQPQLFVERTVPLNLAWILIVQVLISIVYIVVTSAIEFFTQPRIPALYGT